MKSQGALNLLLCLNQFMLQQCSYWSFVGLANDQAVIYVTCDFKAVYVSENTLYIGLSLSREAITRTGK